MPAPEYDPVVIGSGPAGKKATLLRGKVILIATGSTPYRPANLPFEHPGVFDSDTTLTEIYKYATSDALGKLSDGGHED